MSDASKVNGWQFIRFVHVQGQRLVRWRCCGCGKGLQVYPGVKPRRCRHGK